MVLKNLFTGNSGETDIENRLMDMGRGWDRVRCMETVTRKLTLPYVKQPRGICCMAQEIQTGSLCQPRGVGWEENGREVQKGGDICIPMADSC